MSAPDEIRVGSVAYHPRVVTVWERFRSYFADARMPTDYVLYSTYERLVEALLRGQVEIAWNTNTAFVSARELIDGEPQILGMRDIDATYRTLLVVRRGDALAAPAQLAGRRLAVGSDDCAHATILPLHYFAEAGFDAAREATLVRFEEHLGKHGDTGAAELRVVEAVAGGDADAGTLGDATWAAFRASGVPAVGELQVAWRSPVYSHCNFTALPALDAGLASAWSETLLAMDYADPTLRPIMDLEGVRRWLAGSLEGYRDLIEALHGGRQVP
jgi:ABC-type phosphate/phosphonate transport system substrate-binding protein